MEILKKLLRAGLVMLIGALALSDNALAQGFIIPRPMPPQEIVLPQLTSHNVKVEIVDQVSQVTVEQTFYNDSHHPIEGTYYFPLPKAASVSNFKMMIDGKTIGGELLDKDKARQLYEEIVRRNIDPALLEYVDHNLFCARIFPIPPRKERRIVLEYSLLLEQDGDLIQFTYPLRGRVAADRFVARTPHPPRPPRY
ncbi:MAG: VIT domain-containing protein, partial [candidate division KSB1 bacterium]|nr:VIT domain-containing protein [candidate division KSB1 bacterium]